METEIIDAVQTYLSYTGESVNDEFLLLLVQSVIGAYKQQRQYPDGMTEAAIDADVNKYFTNKKAVIATQTIPAMLGKVGAEGHSALIDNQVSRYWGNKEFPIYLPDVVPYCDVV